MIKVENNMLVLDSAFTKEDVLAINHFVKLAEDRVKTEFARLLDEEQQRTKLGFIQYKRALEILGYSEDAS